MNLLEEYLKTTRTANAARERWLEKQLGLSPTTPWKEALERLRGVSRVSSLHADCLGGTEYLERDGERFGAPFEWRIYIELEGG